MNIPRMGTAHSPFKKGFTLVELMIVIVVIGILASITIVSYSNAQPAARDAKRKSDLQSIAEAIQLYRQKYGNDVESGNGCGSGGTGNGWFNYNYPNSILSCLTSKGYLDGGSTFVDPSGCTVSTGTGSANGSPLGYCHAIGGNYYTYMKYTVSGVTCLYARLETEDDTADLTSASSPCAAASSSYVATHYFMNYQLLVK